MEREKDFKPPQYVMLTFEELFRLIICIIIDIGEFAVPILLSPIIGDTLDIIGFWICILLFGWIGCISLLELIPMADYIPIFIITWAVWYYRKRRRERMEWEKTQKKWM